MRHSPKVKINFNKKRSFCYYNLDGKRFKIYNWKSSNKKIEPNKETDITIRRAELIKLKKAIEKDLKIRPVNIENSLYEQSIFNEYE